MAVFMTAFVHQGHTAVLVYVACLSKLVHFSPMLGLW